MLLFNGIGSDETALAALGVLEASGMEYQSANMTQCAPVFVVSPNHPKKLMGLHLDEVGLKAFLKNAPQTRVYTLDEVQEFMVDVIAIRHPELSVLQRRVLKGEAEKSVLDQTIGVMLGQMADTLLNELLGMKAPVAPTPKPTPAPKPLKPKVAAGFDQKKAAAPAVKPVRAGRVPLARRKR